MPLKRNPSRGKKRPRKPREKLNCRFCKSMKDCDKKGVEIDYKDLDMLSKLLTQRGKIYSRKRSGNCAYSQRQAQKAIKQARFMAMLPFTS